MKACYHYLLKSEQEMEGTLSWIKNVYCLYAVKIPAEVKWQRQF